MAIVINSLNPINPTTTAGSSVTFTVNATETGGATLSYQWQFSQDGNTYTSGGLVNNTSSTYTTSNLTINQNGLYFRVAVSDGVSTIYSNEYPGIGDRIVTVTQDPSIITRVDNTVDYYPVSETKSVGETVSFTMSASLTDADITNTTLVSNIVIDWQYSDDDGNNWINISPGGDTSITSTISGFGTDPETYYKYSTLQISNASFDLNLYLYRAIVSFPGAINTPVTLPSITLLIDPTINIYRHPGEGDDTQTYQTYKTSIPNSGDIKLQVGALSTANTTLFFEWQVKSLLGSPDVPNEESWQPISNLVASYNAILKPGTTANTDVLELNQLIYYDEISFRCVISGSSGESTVISNEHVLYSFDVEVSPIVPTNIDIIEDKYGNVPNRDTYLEAEQVASITSSLDIYRNTGLNGSVNLQYQRQDPNSSIWYDVGDFIAISSPLPISTYTSNPTGFQDIEINYETPPLRKSDDDGAKYRLKIESTSLYSSITNGVKTLTPYYSSEIILNVYRTVYILSNPSNTSVYNNEVASFGVSAVVSSGSNSDIIYQWQYNTVNTNTGWQNVPESSGYSGTNTSNLVIDTSISSSTYRYFRCVISLPDQLSSVTTKAATLFFIRDYFIEVTSISDYFLRENSNLLWDVTASSLSQKQITYQWQKSDNISGPWSDISGATANTFQILGLAESDQGYYRLKLVSFGGEIYYTNAASLQVLDVNILVTKNILTSLTVLEGVPGSYLFSCEATSTVGGEITYQWQRKRTTDADFVNIGSGFNNSSDTSNEFSPVSFDGISDDQVKIRCKIDCDEVPFSVYTNECVVTVKRRFTYFADVANKVVTNGKSLVLDLNPFWTGGNPEYSWEVNSGGSWTSLGETSSDLIIPVVDNTYNGKSYRCRVTLTGCDEHEYTRNNTNVITSVGDVEYTQTVSISVVSSASKPSYYSLQTQKTGAAIGTVICVAKPPGYVNNTSENSDDFLRWGISRTGSLTTSGNTSSVETSGSNYNVNKPSWATTYSSPRWNLDNDRFKGYIEMRGQYLRASEFPELARMFGTTYGGNITGAYPRYNSGDVFRMPNLYAKKLLGTGNVNNNRGSVSITPEYGPDEQSGGDKNIPGTIGGRYNYTQSDQLPPGSPGVSGLPDGTAGIGLNPRTFAIGSFRSDGFDEVNSFLQPTFAQTVTYSVSDPLDSFTDTPSHVHTGVSIAHKKSGNIDKSGGCFGAADGLASGRFPQTREAGGAIEIGPYLDGNASGATHSHVVEDIGPGSFTHIEAGMDISSTYIRMAGQSRQVFDNNLSFFLRNAEEIPLNSAYFRLKYLIKAY